MSRPNPDAHIRHVSMIVTALAEYYREPISATQIAMYVDDLVYVPADRLTEAVKVYRNDPKNDRFPLPSKLKALVDTDKRPGPEEAWAMIPTDESASCVWTDEMREAFGSIRHMLDEDPIGARMAFREIYGRLVAEARGARRPVRWEPSLGTDKQGREIALREAERRGLLSYAHVQSLLAEPSLPKNVIQIAGPSEPELSTVDIKAQLAKIKSLIGGES